MTKIENIIIGVSAVAKELGCTPTWVYKLIRSGQLHPIQPYRSPMLFEKKEVSELKSKKEKDNANKNS